MISLYIRKTLTGIKDSHGNLRSYTVFGDNENTKQFYIIPENPEFAVDEKTQQPKFNLIWYYDSKSNNGGVCTFTVALPVPNAEDELKQISAQLKDDTVIIARAHDIYEMVLSMNSGDKPKADALQQALGLNQQQAQNLKGLYNANKGYEQYLPDSDIKLSPVPVTGGGITVRAFGGKDAFQQWQQGDQSAASFTGTYQTTPSLLGNNQAVVSFDLTELGANLFWNAFGGPSFDKEQPSGYKPVNSVVAVTYDVQFEAMLPPAKVTVTLDSKVAAELITKQVTSKDKWGHKHTRTEVVGREFTKDVNSMIDVEIPSTSYLAKSPTDKTNQEKQYGVDLEQWGANQLAEMVKDQLPTVSWDDLQNGIMKEQVLHDETRVFQLSKAIAFEVFPQAQLPTISSLTSTPELAEYFQAINLDKTPYYDVTVTVQPPANLSALKISSVSLTPKFGGEQLFDANNKPVDTLVFDSKKSEALSLHRRFDISKQKNKEVEFDYTVNYTTNTKALTSSGTQDKNYNISLTSPDSLGVVAATLNGAQILWDVFSRAMLTVKYDTIQTQYALTKDAPNATMVNTIGAPVGSTIKYQLELDFASGGGSLTYPLNKDDWAELDISQGTAMLQVPYTNNKTITFLSTDVATKEASIAVIQATYQMTYPGNVIRDITKTLILNENNNGTDSWTVPTTSLESTTSPGTISYDAHITSKSGTTEKKEQNLTSTFVQV